MRKTGIKIIDKIASIIAGKIGKNTPAKSEEEILLSGKIMSTLNLGRTEKIIENIKNAEFKVFSQWGDDGIIQFLVNYLDIREKTFIEFGVEDYRESNTRFLLMNNNWKGFVMDGSGDFINNIIASEYYWKYELTAQALFVDQDNINQFIIENGIEGEIGLLHIDIDGNDYWIWKKIDVIQPIIVIVEFNSVFGINNPWTIPYNKTFKRTDAHYSNLFWGTSLLSLCDLAKEKSYLFIGTNSAGNNAYFVKKGKEKGLKILNAEEGYTQSKYRESRNLSGELTYLSGKKRLEEIKGCEVYNTRTNKIENI
ncbi:MAG: hypothetical protein ABIO55_02945 [Ginsengibacter sp.]